MKKLKRPLRKGSPIRALELKYNMSAEGLFRTLYVDRKLSAKQIAKKLNLNYQTVYHTLRKMKLHRNGIVL